MKKSRFLKILSLVLCVAVIAVSCVFSSGIISFADNLLGKIEVKKNNDIQLLNNSGLTEMKGDYAAPYGLESYGCADVTSIDTEKNFSNCEDVSIDKVGTDGSFALKIDGASADFAYVKIGEAANTLARNTTYVITMKLKKSGTVNSFNSGVHIVSGNTLTEAQSVTDSQLKEDEWTEYSFEYKHTKSRAGWAHLYFKWDIAENSSLYIDDYSITVKNNTHNMAPIGNFDRSIYIDGTIDHSLIENANYAEKMPSGTSGFETVKEIGYKGSYGAKITRTQAKIDEDNMNSAYITFDEAGSFKNNTKYIIEFKAKKSAGLSSFNILFREKTVEHTAISLSKNALNEYVSSENYVLYRVVYETDATASSGQSRIGFYIDGEADSYILLDDIKVYAEDDAEMVSLIKNGSFDAMRIASNDEPIWETVKIPYVIEDYDCISNYTDERNHLPVLAEKYGIVGIEKCGVEESYGLKIKGEGRNEESYITIGSAINQLKVGKEYELTMSVKKKGTVTSFSAGLGHNWKYFYEDFTSDLGDDWVKLSYKLTPTVIGDATDTGWNHLLLKWNLPSGSELYIDDISIIATDDENKTDLFKEGAFDATAHEESIVDERIKEEVLYCPKYLGSTPQNSSVVEYEGFKESYGLKIVGDGERKTAKIRYDSRPGLQNYTEYYIEFKAKRSGNVSYFTAGIQEQWANHNALIFGNANVVEERISDSFYNYYRIKYTTDGNALGSDGTGAWTFITFTYEADDDACILIDDIKVYPTKGENPKETFQKGDFNLVYNDLEFDNTVDGSVYIPRKITEYNTRHNFYVTGTKEEIDSTISIAEKEGVKESAAFKIEGTGVTNTFKISAYSLSELMNGCQYKIGLKVKAEGNVGVSSDNFFRYGLIERWTSHYTLNFPGEKLSRCITDEYHYYQSVITTDNSCDGAWSYLVFSYNLPVGMTLYIDEIELIPISEEASWLTGPNGEALNLFKKSTFDMTDLGSDDINISEEKPANVTPRLSYIYTTLKPQTLAVDDAPSGGYCLGLGFSDEKISGEHMMQMTPAMPGESYKLSFWVKVVGEGHGGFYVSDGRWLNHTYGGDFNQYDTGKWTKVELIYNDKTTPYTATTYRRIKFTFDGPADSGMLIDDIQLVRIDCDYESFDVYGGGTGDFETSDLYPEIDWDKNKRFIYTEGEK